MLTAVAPCSSQLAESHWLLSARLSLGPLVIVGPAQSMSVVPDAMVEKIPTPPTAIPGNNPSDWEVGTSTSANKARKGNGHLGEATSHGNPSTLQVAQRLASVIKGAVGCEVLGPQHSLICMIWCWGRSRLI